MDRKVVGKKVKDVRKERRKVLGRKIKMRYFVER